MGFLLRRGIDRYNGRLTAEPFVKKKGILNLHFEVDTAVYAALDGKVETEEYRFDLFGLRTTAGHEAKVFVTHTYDAPSAPFPIGPVVDSRRRVRLQRHGRVVPHARAAGPSRWRGSSCRASFYDGERTSGNVTLRIRPNRFLRSETTTEINDVNAGGRQLRVEGLPAAPGDGGDAAGAGERVRPVQRPVPGWLRSTRGSTGTTVPGPTFSSSTTRPGTAPA